MKACHGLGAYIRSTGTQTTVNGPYLALTIHHAPQFSQPYRSKAMDKLPVTQADRETAASIRAALYKSCPDIPNYPVGIVEPFLAAHRSAQNETLLEAVLIIAGMLDIGMQDSLVTRARKWLDSNNALEIIALHRQNKNAVPTVVDQLGEILSQLDENLLTNNERAEILIEAYNRITNRELTHNDKLKSADYLEGYVAGLHDLKALGDEETESYLNAVLSKHPNWYVDYSNINNKSVKDKRVWTVYSVNLDNDYPQWKKIGIGETILDAINEALVDEQ